MYIFRKKIVLLFLVFSFPVIASSQWLPKGLKTDVDLKNHNANKLLFNADVIGFFKDNEYFSPIWKGATYPGTRFEPTIGYQIGNKFRADLGFTGLYFSGDKHKMGTYHLFARLQYAIKPNFNLTLGNYFAGVNHELIEPLYKWEDYLITKPESGAQLLFRNKKYFADLWINWENYIERNDPVKEELNFGISASVLLTSSNSPIDVKVPLQLIIHHRGGQIDTSPARMVVLGNAATGICADYKVETSFLKKIGVDLYAVGYYDKLPDKSLRPYNKGFGIYPVVKLSSKEFTLQAGYWYARKFYSEEGEPLFASFNTNYPGNVLPTRHLMTIKLSYEKKLHKLLSLGAMAETYSSLSEGRTDYSFGVYLHFHFPTTISQKKVHQSIF